MLEKIIVFGLLIVCVYLFIFDFKNFVQVVNFIFESVFVEIVKITNFITNSKNWR